MMLNAARAKIKPLGELVGIVGELRWQGKRIVFTNGCFDLLYAGHIAYLAQAKALGDALIVGLNSDASVRALKGNERPAHATRRPLFDFGEFGMGGFRRPV